MKALFFALAAIGVCCGQRCPSVCFDVYEPVCGTDGKTYSNRCYLGVANCQSNGKIALDYTGRCEAKPTCAQYCPEYYSPVCGSNNVTYDNKCFLSMYGCQKGMNLTIQYHGKCMNQECPRNGCPEYYRPICGADSKTYDNECFLRQANCNRAQKVGWFLEGKCLAKRSAAAAASAASACPSICFAVYSPVCGSDGKTYSNRCKLGLRSCQTGRDIRVVSAGRCAPWSVKRQVRNCPTICMALYAPVCGTDGKTYSNRCYMNSAACRAGKTVKVAKTGRC